jgi:hypothetical protein
MDSEDAPPPAPATDGRDLALGNAAGFVLFVFSVGGAWVSLREAAHVVGGGAAAFAEGPWFGPVALFVGAVPLYVLFLRVRRTNLTVAAGMGATALICAFLFFAFWILVH